MTEISQSTVISKHDPVRLTAKMLDTRDTMKRFWGDRYAEKVAPYREAIRNRASYPDRPSRMAAALEVCKTVASMYEGIALGLAIAGAVDECEAEVQARC